MTKPTTPTKDRWLGPGVAGIGTASFLADVGPSLDTEPVRSARGRRPHRQAAWLWDSGVEVATTEDVGATEVVARNDRAAQVQVAERQHGHVVEQGASGDVDALGDLGVVVADQLSAKQPAGSPIAGQAQVQLLGRLGSRPCGRTGPIRSS